ncbi:MAG: hypothetical protein M1272_04685 [Firmicutes bacterium]|nr:hypothetical protein [Bacillota bacterium]
MPVKEKGPAKKREPRRFPPSLAGSCLRYAVMDVLGFGRLIDPESQQAMREGTDRHKVFQQQLLADYAMARVEVPLRDESWGVSGRMDALIETPRGPWVVEYKTVSEERFRLVEESGPILGHWAQLQLYLAVGRMVGGSLVVDQRPSGERLIFHAEPDPVWDAWIRARINQVKAFQTTRKLPSREVSRACLSCDRWQRCFASEADRQNQVSDHPLWEPEPPVPARAAFQRAEEIVS